MSCRDEKDLGVLGLDRRRLDPVIHDGCENLPCFVDRRHRGGDPVHASLARTIHREPSGIISISSWPLTSRT